ncbi:MAG: hypothetical protein MK289_07065 [Trichodesmium sp. ALOHA_ZT_67]|nr:hypothetical protein [Trichodesmium erythraeum GBRTRLIN201]MCH2048232.1 hypothetical protein [Trichodesmium sp. ALOHA_ZT_67]MDE5095224.1 hypothetical protein [Trichodesmium sp. St11_bin5]MDT9341716.1 hypothetical protein [Trichodesmium erythraeum 21-75]
MTSLILKSKANSLPAPGIIILDKIYQIFYEVASGDIFARRRKSAN